MKKNKFKITDKMNQVLREACAQAYYMLPDELIEEDASHSCRENYRLYWTLVENVLKTFEDTVQAYED